MKASLKTGAWVAALGALMVLVAACGDRGGAEQPPMPGDKAVARVNGKTIWASDVRDQAVRDGVITEGEPLDVSTDLFAQELQAVIDRKLLAAEALRRRVDRDAVAQRRLAAAREEILGYMLVESSVSGAINENAIRGVYNEQLGLARNSDELKFRQIVLATQVDAEAVLKLLTGGAPFETLALERSTDIATKFNDGGLQDYTVIDLLPPTYQTALKDAKVGDVVGPFQSEEGWVIVRVEDRRLEQPIPLETARPQIIRFLTYDQVRVLLQRLREGAKVDMLITPSPEGSTRPTEPASAPLAGARPPAAASTAPAGAPAASPGTAGPAGAPPPKAPPAPPPKTPASEGANP